MKIKKKGMSEKGRNSAQERGRRRVKKKLWERREKKKGR
jgi:hypothetical protein